MGDPPKQRRRIVPQRVEPSEVAANSGPAHSGEVLQSPQGDHRYASRLNLQEQVQSEPFLSCSCNALQGNSVLAPAR